MTSTPLKSFGPQSDLKCNKDIRTLVDTFYTKVQADSLLAPVFNDSAKIDWQHHLPIMYRFWETLLFHSGGYEGNPFSKHVVLPIGAEHFQRWLSLFLGTVDQLFVGTKADEAKTRARMIADVFQRRMGLAPTSTTLL